MHVHAYIHIALTGTRHCPGKAYIHHHEVEYAKIMTVLAIIGTT
jgi:hypothetical protein